MKIKRKMALMLAAVMLIGSIGMMKPTEVRAEDASNTFTLTVPADANITKAGWNDIGNIEVSNVSIAPDKVISVTIEDGARVRWLKKSGDASKKIRYILLWGTSDSDTASGTLKFRENGTEAIGADVNDTDFSTAEAGNYEDTINFTATLENGITTNIEVYAIKPTIDIGDTTYIYATTSPSGASENLIWSSSDPTIAQVRDTGGTLTAEATGIAEGTATITATTTDGSGLYASCTVTVRSVATVERTLTGEYANGKKINSNDLLASDYSTFEYEGTTYTAYNGFIGKTSNATKADALAFVSALNEVKLDGRTGGWTLITSADMAHAWWMTTGAEGDVKGASSIDSVAWIWVDDSTCENRHCLLYQAADYDDVSDQKYYLWLDDQLPPYASPMCGFVVLRDSTQTP